MKKIAGVLGILLVAGAAVADTVFLDDFNRADSATVGNGWTEVGGDESISASNLLFSTGGTAGREWITRDASAFASPYTTTLANNPGTVTWSFHMRQSRTDPSGFDASNYGIAMILAASDADLTAGSGYAVAVGQSGTTDALRLVRYNNGIDANANVANIISGLDIGIDYLSVRVTYNPANNNWALYASTNTAGFAGDPWTEANQIGAATADTTYTGVALGYYGAMFNHATGASETARFDNFNVGVVPEPASAGLLLAAGLGFAFRRLRSRK
jgi:hypothetical protein